MTSKGGRPSTGSSKWQFNPKRIDPETLKPAPGPQWFGRVKKADDSRPFVPLDPPSCSRTGRPRLRARSRRPRGSRRTPRWAPR